jgi:hypothetical protein
LLKLLLPRREIGNPALNHGAFHPDPILGEGTSPTTGRWTNGPTDLSEYVVSGALATTPWTNAKVSSINTSRCFIHSLIAKVHPTERT